MGKDDRRSDRRNRVVDLCCRQREQGHASWIGVYKRVLESCLEGSKAFRLLGPSASLQLDPGVRS